MSTTLPGTTAQFSAQADDTVQVPRLVQADQAAQTEPGRPAGAPGEVGENARAFAITSFVLGIASVVSGWTFIAPITGLILGVLALRRNTTERTLALWGVWLNAAMLALTALAALIAIALLGFGLITIPFLAA